MALLGNIIWFVLAGWWNFLVYAAFGLLFCITIIGIPIGKALFQYAKLMALPFGKVIVKETELKGKENVASVRRVGGTIANILWLPFGIATFLTNIGLMIACAISIVGIPAAVVLARSCKFLLWPVGAKVVTKAEYDNIILRRTIAASINAAVPNAAPYTTYTPVDKKYKVEDFFSKPAWIGVGIPLGISALLSSIFIISENGTRGIKLLPTFLGGYLLGLLIVVIIAVALALLISWIRSKVSSTPFWGIRFSSVSDFFSSVRDLFVTLLEDSIASRVIFAIIFLFTFFVPGLIGLLIGATLHRDSRYPADAVNAIAGSENAFPANQPSYQYQQSPVVGTSYPQSTPNVLVKTPSALWMPGLPIVVTQADIAKTSPNSPDVSLLLSFQNLCDQPIIGVYFSARCYNLLQQELQPVPKQSVQDFTLNPGAVWTSQLPVSIPENDTRRIELIIHNVIMADGSIWNNDAETSLSPLAEQQSLTLPAELYAELQRVRAQDSNSTNTTPILFSYAPHKDDGYWRCACGQLNLTDKCIKCGHSEETVFQIVQPQFLTEKRDVRLQEEARIREERKQAVVYQQEAIKNTAGKIGRKLSTGGTIVVDKLCFFKDWLWYKVLDLWDWVVQQGEDFFEKHAPVVRQKCADGFSCAKNRLAAFYTDTAKPCASKAVRFLKEKVFPYWKKILIVTGIVVIVAVVSVVAVNQYQEYRAEQERIQQEEAARLEAERQQEEEEKRRLEEEQRKLEEERQKEENRKQLEADLPDIFQRAFDAYSNGQVSEDNRINSELTFAKMLIEGRSVAWEDTFRVQYLKWRENKILTINNQLICEYEQIIAECPIYEELDENASGLYYAGYHDFDNNGFSELLLLFADKFKEGNLVGNTIRLEVYGENGGKVVQYGETLKIYSEPGYSWLNLMRHGDNLYIATNFIGGGNASSQAHKFYEVSKNGISIAERLSCEYGFNYQLGMNATIYKSSEKEITYEQFVSALAKYSDEMALCISNNELVCDRGVLTQPINRTIIANGQTLSLTEPLYMSGRYTLVPVRPVLEALGIPVYVAADMLTILASTKTDTLDIYNYGRMWGMMSDEYLANFNNEPVSINTQMIDGILYASIEPLVALFGAQWKYDPTARVLTITMNTDAENLMTAAELEALANFSYEEVEQILAQLGYWISGSEDEWDTRHYISNGTAFWEVYVLPFGVEYEAYDNGIVFVGNSIPVTVTSNGEVIW